MRRFQTISEFSYSLSRQTAARRPAAIRSIASAAQSGDHGIAARQRGSVEMIDRLRVALQLKMNQMDQGPAHRQQWRITSGGIEEIALAGRIQALDAEARVDFQLIAADDAARRPPVRDRQRAGGDVVGGAKMGADPAALGAVS